MLEAKPCIEVSVIPEHRHRGEAADVRKAQLTPGGSQLPALLGCLEQRGKLRVWEPQDREAAPATAEGQYRDFLWEEPALSGRSVRLLAIGEAGELKMFDVGGPAPLSLHCASQLPATSLLHAVRERDPSVCELRSVRVLSCTAARCVLLIDHIWLLQLQWPQSWEEAEPQTLSCCSIGGGGSGGGGGGACVSREMLFVAGDAGLVSVFSLSDGVLAASVDLPAYLSHGAAEDGPPPPPSPFCLLQVSADLSTVVAVSPDHTAVAVDLDDYFRIFPQHLLTSAPQPRPPATPRSPRDEDGLLSSRRGLDALGVTFSCDRSWEARLAATLGRASVAPARSSSRPWCSSLPGLELRPSPPPSSRAPRGGARVRFSAPDSSTPSLLTVCEFSALLTFVSPGNSQTTVALWDLESGEVSCHRAEDAAAPLQCCGDEHHSLLLKNSGVFQVLFHVSQQDLLSRLMLFGSAATVDALCHLNNWGRCSIPIHALQAGLKNRQLDTVEFFLKSKENTLTPPVSASDTPTAATHSLRDGVQQLCPALDLLCSAVRDSNSEAQSRQFSEQLLHITMSFINTQIRCMLSNTQYEDDASVLDCVDVLDRYIIELRSYMKRFPWSTGGGASTAEASTEQELQEDEWELLSTEELVRQSILTNQIPRAQVVLRGRGRAEQQLAALRTEGLRQVTSCLQRRDLQTANTMLANMGFSVKKQLHNICLHTDEPELREFVVAEVCRRSFFSEEELQSVAFIRRIETLGALPPPAHPLETTSHSCVKMVQKDEEGAELLEELLRRGGSKGVEPWRRLRLDWVRKWGRSIQTSVLLSRLHHSELTSCDAAVLWHHLTSLHARSRVVDWIQSSPGSEWPELTPEVVSRNTACSHYMRETVLDLLARRGVLVPDELADPPQLLWRLAQAGGVMVASPPSHPQLRLPLGLDVHSLVIRSCLDGGLQYLLYSYLEHHRLTPRNCPLLLDHSMTQNHPWFEMMVKIQEISRDLTDPACIFQASLTSAQVLLPGSQPSLSSLLLEGHSLLALATIMFSPGGVDQVVSQGERSGRSETSVDPQLLKMALTSHPKLKAALFPAGPRGHATPSDVSVYHLLQALHPLDPSRLFGWQTANTLNSTETTELPHFSSPQLVQRFALMEKLDFLFYLRHGRPSFAFATFLLQHLSGCSDVPRLLQRAWEQVYRLALTSFNMAPVAAAAVCFCELLGICSLKLRVDLKVMNIILRHWQQRRIAPAQHLHTLVSQGVKLLEAQPGAAEEMIGFLETAVTDSLEQRGVSRSSYEAAQEWALPVQFCQLHALPLSSVYPAHCASDGQLIHFLLFVQLHNFPPQQVRSLVAQFGPALQAHLSLAFQDLQVYRQKVWVGAEGSPWPQDPPRELFQVMLQSQEEAEPCKYLLREALLQRCPLLAVLAACQQEAELLPCLCVWVLTSINDVTMGEAIAHLAEAPQDHEWTLHDLSIIWRTLLGRGLVRTLIRGFQLFQKDCPLLLVLRMFELCCDYRNFPEAKAKLLDFQRTLVSLRNGGAVPPGGLPLQWVESQASVLLLTVLQRCSSQFDLHRLLQLLADVDKLLKSNGPDFRKLSQLSQLLQGTDVSLSPRLLQCTSPSVQQEEFQAAVDALQTRGFYSQARQVAQLAGLSVHRLLLSQLQQEVTSQKTKCLWRRLETRAAFWRKCHEQLTADGTDPESALQFFLGQEGGGAELADLQEHCLLLALAARWLSQLRPAPLERLQSLEKQQWVGRVRQHVLAVAMETESVFNPPPPSAMPDINSYQALMKEFSFSNILDLNDEVWLSVEGLPSPSHQQDTDSDLSPDERAVLTVLVGQLLDDGSVHEASRVCRYFILHHPDLWVVLSCRGLASGELLPQALQEPSGEPIRPQLTTSTSFSSLSSFVMLPLPEDEVAVQLQRLVDQCRHGNNYCKQVLSLYQLSKEMQSSFALLCKEEPCLVLEKLLQSEQPERFRKAQAFIRAQGLSAPTVADLVASSVATALLASTQDLQPAERQVFRPSEGRDSLVQLIKLCEDPNLVGVKVLENLNGLPLRDLSCVVELLIVAHDCFSLTCNMEGIVRVLQAARHLSHAHLAPGEHYGLLVRLLTGIGRYNEMTYIFDLLHQNHRFEMLLRKKMDTHTGQSSTLRTALLDYIKRFLPADSEKHNMVALCFSMRREIAENHEMAARTQLKIIEAQQWVVTPDLQSSLVKVLGLLKDAAESFAKDSCVRQATRCVRTAKLVALQLHFLDQPSKLRIINLRASELPEAAMALPRCFQVFVLAEAYSYSPDWAELVYQKVVVGGDFVYLEELKQRHLLTSGLFEDIFRKLDGAPSSLTPSMKRLLTYCDDVYSRYRLAYQQNLHDVTKSLLQDPKTSSYLNDRLDS